MRAATHTGRHRHFIVVALLGSALVANPGAASAQSNDGHERTRPIPSTTCRVSGMDAQGRTRIVLIRVDASRAWSIVEEAVLTECRAAYRLSGCFVVNCL
jgi:hypothetical protein